MGESTQARRCPKCGQTQPFSAFHKNKRRKNGISSWCKECAKANSKRWRDENVESVEKCRREKYAESPDAFRARSRAWAEKNPTYVAESKRAYYAANRDQLKAVTRVRALANPEKHKARIATAKAKKLGYYRAMSARNSSRRRARLAEAAEVPFTTEQLQQRVAYYGHSCWVCGAPFEAIDHVKPLFAGGPHMLANLRPICTPCNSRKAGQWPYLPKTGDERADPRLPREGQGRR